MPRRRNYYRDRSRVASEDSCSSRVSDLDEWCENDSETDLTEPEPPRNDHSGSQLGKPTRKHGPSNNNGITRGLRQTLYADLQMIPMKTCPMYPRITASRRIRRNCGADW
jgi:hypothetical protein